MLFYDIERNKIQGIASPTATIKFAKDMLKLKKENKKHERKS